MEKNAVIYEEFKERKTIQQYLFVFDIIRIFLVTFFIVSVYDYFFESLIICDIILLIYWTIFVIYLPQK